MSTSDIFNPHHPAGVKAPARRAVVAGGLSDLLARDRPSRGDTAGGTLSFGRDAPVLAATDTALMAEHDPRACLRLGYVPWRRIGTTTVLAVASDDRIAAVRAQLPPQSGSVAFAVAPRCAIEAAIVAGSADRLRALARDRCPLELSCRGWAATRRPLLLPAVLLGCLCVTLAAPYAALTAVLVWITLANLGTMILRGVALADSLGRPRDIVAAGPDVIPLSRSQTLPTVSILIPLLREDVVLRRLIAQLARTTYPKHLLDVKLVLEGDDHATPLALAQIALPDWVSVLRVPADTLRTKPRAMNYALDFCDGQIVGVYDAEDRPEPDQLMKIVSRLHFGPPDLACVQGHLDFYNARQNWLARCFTIEYAMWFRVLLGGVQRLGMPIPLGGTTVFFRREVLEKVGAWDAHNVTEDADLGMRLARFGYRTEMVATTTMEEANCHALPWVRQRSRWLKGYAVTWATHMRRPRQLWRDLGPAGFFGFQVIFLGGLTAYLSVPLFWVLWTATLGLDLPVWDHVATPVWVAFFASMIIGEVLMLAVACRAVWPRPRRHLLPAILLLPLYWPLGAIAGYRAVFEVFHAPFHWHKTSHGL